MQRVAVLSLLLLAGACAGNITPARQIDDAVLAQQVREALSRDAALSGYDITVNVSSGRVTLLGVVGTALQRQRAVEIARAIPGVTEVDNLLSVR